MEITIKAARINRGYTQKESATALEINKNTYANYENYKTTPDISTAKRIAELFGRNVDEIKWTV